MGLVASSLRTASVLVVCAGLVQVGVFVTAATPPAARGALQMPGLADSLAMIRDLLDRGRGIEAENVARALLARVESVRGRDALDVAEVLDLLGRAVRRSSRVSHEEKQAIAERALAIREQLLDRWHPDVATSLTTLAIERTLAGDPASAKPLLERALTIRERALGPDDLSVAATLQSLAGLAMTMRDDTAARALIARALAIREARHGESHVDTIRTLVKLGIFSEEVADYAGARQHYERALPLAERSLGASHPLVFDILLRLAVVLADGIGDYASAARLNERVLGGLETTFGMADPRLRLPLANLAMDLRDLGAFTAARTRAERSLAIAERAFGPRHPAVADGLHTLATVLAAQGAYAEAMRLFERATDINEEALRPPDPELSRAAWFIRDLFPVSGYGTEDTTLFEEAVAVRERGRGLADPRTAESLTNLAAVLSRVDDYKRTRPVFERALTAQETVLGPHHPEVAAAAANLGYVLLHSGNPAAATPLYERAFSIWEKALGPDHPKVARALTDLADLPGHSLGDPTSLLRRALAIQERTLGPGHPDVAETLGKLATLAVRTGATAAALETAARAEAIRQDHLALTARTLSERQALAYAASESSALDVLLSVAAQSAGGDPSTLAWNAVIRARGMVLDEMAARHRVASGTDDPEIAALTKALAAARQRLAAAVVRGIRNAPPEQYRRLLDQARTEKDRAERNLAERSASFRDSQERSRVGLAELMIALPPESALIGFVRYRRHHLERAEPGTARVLEHEPSYLAFVLRSGDAAPAVVSIGSAVTIDQLVLQWQQLLTQEAMAGGRATTRGEAAYRRLATRLRQEVWDPLLPHVSTAKRVFVVPDGALHLVGFAALPTTAARYLVETGPLIHYLSTERDLVRSNGPPAGVGLLALGSPAYDQLGPAPSRPDGAFRGSRSDCEDFQSMRFEPLPASLGEVDTVVRLWNQAQAGTRRLIGAAATEAAFKAQAAGHRVLHLATHGFFLGERCRPNAHGAPLVLSGLILAGANQRHVASAEQEDGVLTAEEVAALDLRGLEWAVLSGCDTGLGEIRVGEGVFGLRRAFQVAGAGTVIMSLWTVGDQTTAQWMAQLYESRLTRRLSTADSVREASLAVLRQRRATGLSQHPFYWAGFVASGDWR